MLSCGVSEGLSPLSPNTAKVACSDGETLFAETACNNPLSFAGMQSLSGDGWMSEPLIRDWRRYDVNKVTASRTIFTLCGTLHLRETHSVKTIM